ncbi:TetR/AcrR family transcriptional regulator [uncultured Algoriphagus sp.]|uniref:TetR/AcrR family transcriptional regulator n=1 Tax=uncultured Algoriphagus sp. TaxID=417365 RepID=UPI0030ED93DA|tara:strand:- start:14272 stop:14871 length:600 start_codon:yes stop_codon:yes gene_type:complete
MSKADLTRQFIIEKTSNLFNKSGYAGTSMTDITSATGLTKGSIYGNFKNKEEVAIEVFRYNSGRLAVKMSSAIGSEKSAYNQLVAFTDFYRNNWDSMLEKGGCPLLNSATEMDDALPFMKTEVLHSFKGLTERITRIIEFGIQQKEFKENISISSAAYASLFLMLIEGGILLAKTFEKQDYLNQALDRVLKIINDEIVK